MVSQLAKKAEFLILTVGMFHARREETISVTVMEMRTTLSYFSAFTDDLFQWLTHVVRAPSSAANIGHVYPRESIQHGPSGLNT
jgi:hypothetical protein